MSKLLKRSDIKKRVAEDKENTKKAIDRGMAIIDDKSKVDAADKPKKDEVKPI